MLVVTLFTSLLQKREIIPALTDSWDRMTLWEAVFKANPDPIIGVGTGDYKQELNNYYRSNNLPYYAEQSYNTHNQLLQIYFSQGLVGVSVFLLLIFRLLYRLQKNDLTLGILFFFPFLVYGVNEVFLGRYQGVVFFILIHQVCNSMVVLRQEKMKLASHNG